MQRRARVWRSPPSRLRLGGLRLCLGGSGLGGLRPVGQCRLGARNVSSLALRRDRRGVGLGFGLLRFIGQQSIRSLVVSVPAITNALRTWRA